MHSNVISCRRQNLRKLTITPQYSNDSRDPMNDTTHARLVQRQRNAVFHGFIIPPSRYLDKVLHSVVSPCYLHAVNSGLSWQLQILTLWAKSLTKLGRCRKYGAELVQKGVIIICDWLSSNAVMICFTTVTGCSDGNRKLRLGQGGKGIEENIGVIVWPGQTSVVRI